jgi:hypothetical protein
MLGCGADSRIALRCIRATYFIPQEKPAEFNQALEAIVTQFVPAGARK